MKKEKTQAQIEANRRRNKKWRQLNPEKFKAQCKIRRIKSYIIHKEKIKQNARNERLSLKLKILSHYGGGSISCKICGESRLDCLSIDHLDGGGSKHRKEVKSVGGIDFYWWLKRNEYPNGYQVLCMNCQFISHRERERAKL